MDPAAVSISRAEYVCVDTETNGRPGDDCELTEVGAVLVGGGELHERFESLVRTERPLSRGIERFTGITQQMVDGAPPPAEVLPRLKEMVEGRVLVAHSASFDRRVLAQAYERTGIEWTEPPILCTVAMARRFAPLARQRKLAPLAEALGIEVQGVHRALVDAETCARVFCALFPKLCASGATLADAIKLLQPRRGARRRKKEAGRKVPREERPDLTKLPDDPGVYIFRDVRGRPLYVGKSVSLKTRARAHFCAPAGWTEKAEVVDYKPTHSELGALVLENRLIKQWRPAGNVKLKRSDGYVYIRARLDISFPILEVAPEPAAGLAINVGPVRGSDAARELIDQLNSLFALRHCGRALPRRDSPSAYGQMGRCLSPCLRDLDPNAYRRRLDEALASRKSRSRWPTPRSASATSALRCCCGGATGSPGWSSGSRGCSRPATRAPGSCSRSTPPSRSGTRSGSSPASWPTGGRCRRPTSWPIAPGVRSTPGRCAASRSRPRPWTRSGSCRRGSPHTTRRGSSWTSRRRRVGSPTGYAVSVCPDGGWGTDQARASKQEAKLMGIMDKVTGRVKQAAGDLADDASLRREGRQEERKGDAKEELGRAQEKADSKADEVANLERKTN
jgi:DNA polymerase III epsilon subunit family exonuclease